MNKRKAAGLSLFSGGLDSQLAVCVLQEQGVHVEGVVFKSPFFKIETAVRAAESMGLKLHAVDFTTDILGLLNDPPHGFGGNLNPCIDCHALMIQRAGEMMTEMGYDFIATGEVLGQRPMSQRRHSLNAVEMSSGFAGRVVRPLCALHLKPTIPEQSGLIIRERLLKLQGRSRKPQLELAEKFGLKHYPSPSGGCLLTEKSFCTRLQDLLQHEGVEDERLAWMLRSGRHLRLPGGGKCVVGRDSHDNAALKAHCRPEDTLLHTVNIPGPTLLIPLGCSAEDLTLAASICATYGAHRELKETLVRVHRNNESSEITVPVISYDEFADYLL